MENGEIRQDDSSSDDFFRNLNEESPTNFKNAKTHQVNLNSNQADLHPFETKAVNSNANITENLYLPRNRSKRTLNAERRKTYEPGTFDHLKNDSSDIETNRTLQQQRKQISENDVPHNQNNNFFFSQPKQNYQTNETMPNDFSSEDSYNEQDTIKTFNSFRWRTGSDQHNSPANSKTIHCNKKSQTPTPKLEITNTIAIDFYYTTVNAFDVDPNSLEFHIYKRTKKAQPQYVCNSLNFASRYLPDVQFQEADDNNKNEDQTTEKTNNQLNVFNDDIEQIWMKTLNKYRSMKSKIVIYNSIRLSEYDEYVLTVVKQETSKAKSIFSQHQIRYFCFSLSEEDFEAYEKKWKSKIDLDLFHIYVCHVLSIDLCRVIHNLHSKLNKSDNENRITVVNSIVHYICKWISLFPDDFSFKPEQMTTESNHNSIPFKLIDLIDQIIVDYPSHVQILMDLRAAIYLIYSSEFDPSLFYHYPYLKTTIKDDKNLYFQNLFELKIQPHILVKHFTYVELSLLAKLKREDLISNIELSESVKSMIRRFDETCSFILSTIVKRNDGQQVHRALYWIEVMNEAMKNRSYQLMYEIENAFSSNLMESILLKLPDTQFSRFTKMRDFIYSQKYESDLSKKKEFCMPFFAVILNNINRSYIALSNKPNQTIEKFSMFIYQIEFLLDRWGTEYAFGLNSSLLAAIQMLDGKFTSSSELP